MIHVIIMHISLHEIINFNNVIQYYSRYPQKQLFDLHSFIYVNYHFYFNFNLNLQLIIKQAVYFHFCLFIRMIFRKFTYLGMLLNLHF